MGTRKSRHNRGRKPRYKDHAHERIGTLLAKPEAIDASKMPTTKTIDVAKLHEHIAMPDWQKRIVPLLAFRGRADAYRIRALNNIRLWNVPRRDGIVPRRH